MTFTSILSWVAAAVLLLGLKLMGDKRVIGFYMASVAQVIWMAWGLLMHTPATVVVNCCALVMYVRAIRKWEQLG